MNVIIQILCNEVVNIIRYFSSGEKIYKESRLFENYDGRSHFFIVIAIIWVISAQYAHTKQKRRCLVNARPSAKIVVLGLAVIVKIFTRGVLRIRNGGALAIIDLKRHNSDGAASSVGALKTIKNDIALGTQQKVEGFGDRVPLQASITLTANPVLDKQNFLDRTLTPLHAVWNRS